MSNLQKFNSTLEDLGKEVGKFKEVSEAYQKLQKLIVAYDKISKQFDQNNETLNKINELQETQQAKIEKLIEEKTDQIRKENKDFYKDLESTIRIKLDENKSQIKQLIETERTQIKQIFEIEYAKNTKELRSRIEIESKKQTQVLLDNQYVIKVALPLSKLYLIENVMPRVSLSRDELYKTPSTFL